MSEENKREKHEEDKNYTDEQGETGKDQIFFTYRKQEGNP